MAGFGGEIVRLAFSAIAGGIAGHFTSRRAERDNAIAELVGQIDDVADLAEDYWCLEGSALNADRMARRLKAKLKNIGRLNTRLQRRHATYRFAPQEKIIALRKAATSGNFDVVGRAAETSRVEKIHDAAALLQEAVRDSRCYIWQIPPGDWKDIVRSFLRR